MIDCHPPNGKSIVLSLTVQLNGDVPVGIGGICCGGPISETLVLPSFYLTLDVEVSPLTHETEIHFGRKIFEKFSMKFAELSQKIMIYWEKCEIRATIWYKSKRNFRANLKHNVSFRHGWPLDLKQVLWPAYPYINASNIQTKDWPSEFMSGSYWLIEGLSLRYAVLIR